MKHFLVKKLNRYIKIFYTKIEREYSKQCNKTEIESQVEDILVYFKLTKMIIVLGNMVNCEIK